MKLYFKWTLAIMLKILVALLLKFQVFYAGDIHAAKLKVNDLIRQMGYIPVDRGSIRSAREIEDIPVRQFPEWKTPLIISSILFVVFFLLAFSK